MDSLGKKAGKGALIQEEKSGTLGVSQDQYLFQPITYDARGNGDGKICSTIVGQHECTIGDYTNLIVQKTPDEVYGVDCYNQTITKERAKCMTNKATDSDHVPCVLETFHCLTDTIAPPIKARDYKDPLVVCYGFDQGASRDVGDLFIEEISKTITNGTCPDHHNGVVIAMDRAIYNQGENARYDFECRVGGAMPPIVARGPGAVCYWNGENKVGTLTSHNANGSQRMPDKEHFNCVIEENEMEYVVRRLTPKECQRLQGFPDGWGMIDHKEDFTDEEYRFWLEVRNTWAETNGKQTKEYTKEQMVKWYNKLHTDSAEYKMWGNGIGLPNALYVMEGIVKAIKEYEDD